jgi:hypothetical protein
VAIDSPQWQTFNALRAETVTNFVKEFRDAMKASKPSLILAGFGDTDPDMERRCCGRDWGAWGKRGLIEEFYLATYTEKADQMVDTVQRARAALGPNVKILAAMTPFNNFVTSNDQMKTIASEQMRGGADGVWVYREDALQKLDLWAGVKAANELVRERQATK